MNECSLEPYTYCTVTQYCVPNFNLNQPGQSYGTIIYLIFLLILTCSYQCSFQLSYLFSPIILSCFLLLSPVTSVPFQLLTFSYQCSFLVLLLVLSVVPFMFLSGSQQCSFLFLTSSHYCSFHVSLFSVVLLLSSSLQCPFLFLLLVLISVQHVSYLFTLLFLKCFLLVLSTVSCHFFTCSSDSMFFSYSSGVYHVVL